MCQLYSNKIFKKYASSRMARNFNMNNYERESIETRGLVSGEGVLGYLWLSRAF